MLNLQQLLQEVVALVDKLSLEVKYLMLEVMVFKLVILIKPMKLLLSLLVYQQTLEQVVLMVEVDQQLQVVVLVVILT